MKERRRAGEEEERTILPREFLNESSNLEVLCFRELPLVNIITPPYRSPFGPPTHAFLLPPFRPYAAAVSNLIPRLFSPIPSSPALQPPRISPPA